MLIVVNGVPKSGSYWLYTLCADALGGERPPPAARLRADWATPSMTPENFAAFIESGEHRAATTLIKTHLPTRRPYPDLMKTDGVLALMTVRNLHDGMLSLYHHHRRVKRTALSVEDWWREEGRDRAQGHLRFRRVWTPVSAVFEYERLMTDPVSEIGRLGRLLGVDMPAARAYEIARARNAADQTRLIELGHVRTGAAGRALVELPQEVYLEISAMLAAEDAAKKNS